MNKTVDKKTQFINAIKTGYQFSENNFVLGAPIFAGKLLAKLPISVGLATLNRHGLIAGATGTGKTRTIQKIAESLSSFGCPILMMDIKGDLSGMSQPGVTNSKVEARLKQIKIPWEPQKFPVEFFSISNEPGVRMRATVSEFGPVLFARILELNDTQSSVVSLVFKYCDDHKLPLLDFKDFKKALQFLTNEGKEETKKEYGVISAVSTNTIMRKMIELEQQGDLFFGEKSFDITDFVRTDAKGYGYINIFRITDIQNKPKLFSSFMLCLLAEIFEKFPEVGDIDKPKLIIFIDEAHLIFNQASKSLLEQLDNIIKLIRSKGVGIFFCTQNPADIPDSILGQLGMKIQHSLHAFTAKDRKAIKLIAENFPNTEFYDVAELLTALGIGEALVTVLNEKGLPTPLADTLIYPPESYMGSISNEELSKIIAASKLVDKYKEPIDRESAYEILNAKLKQHEASKDVLAKSKQPPASRKKTKSTLEKIASSSLTRTVVREITRGILGTLTGKKR